MRAKEFIIELHLPPDVDEGWKDWVAGAAMGAAALGGAQDANAKQPVKQQTAQHQQVQKVSANKLLPLQKMDPATNPETNRIANTINRPVAATLIKQESGARRIICIQN